MQNVLFQIPSSCCLTHPAFDQFVGLVAALLKHFFADNEEPNFFRGEDVEVVEEDVAKLLGSLTLSRVAGGLKYLIHTSPGEGPEVLQVRLLPCFELLSLVHQGDGDALLDKNGMPKNLVR